MDARRWNSCARYVGANSKSQRDGSCTVENFWRGRWVGWWSARLRPRLHGVRLSQASAVEVAWQALMSKPLSATPKSDASLKPNLDALLTWIAAAGQWCYSSTASR